MVVLSAETMLTWFYLELGYVCQLLILINLNSFIASQTFPGSLYSNLANIRPSRTLAKSSLVQKMADQLPASLVWGPLAHPSNPTTHFPPSLCSLPTSSFCPTGTS